MTSAWRIRWALVLAMTVALPALVGSRDTRGDDSVAPAAAVKTAPRGIDLFDGMKSGDLDVKFIPHNANEAQILVKNNTDQPLTVKLPDAFAAVPVLAQAAAGGAARQPRQQNQNQAVGGGGGLGGAGGGRQGGGGAFDVAPEKTVKVKVATVCLEHGKKEPNANVPYELRTIDSYTSDPKVQELCKLVGAGDVSQRSAQAAAWHFANHMTWEELTNKKTHHLIGGDEVYFTAAEIRGAIQIADKAMKQADSRTAPSANTPSSQN
jgi:hypothetical protein